MNTPLRPDTSESLRKIWPRIVARAWSDDAFLSRLMSEPQQVVQEYKLPLLDNGITYKVVRGDAPPSLSADALVLSVPLKPESLKVESMEELAAHAEQRRSGNSSCI